MDPVTDDLDWDLFSADLADGIVVSILDSFVLELPILDFSMVQSVFEELDKTLPPPEDQVQQIIGKEEYFQDILISAQTQTEESADKNSAQREDLVKQSVEEGKYNRNTVTLLQREMKTPLGKKLAQPDDKLQQGLEEEFFEDTVNLSCIKLHETQDRSSLKHTHEGQQSIGKDLTSSASIELCQIEQTDLDTQSNGISKTTDKTLVHSSSQAVSNIQDNAAFTKKQLNYDEQGSHVQTKEAGPSLDDTLGRLCSLAVPNVDEKELFQDSVTLLQTQLCQSEGNSLVESCEPGKSALEPATCYAPWFAEANEVESDETQTASSSSVLNASRKTLHEEKNNSDVRVNSTRKSNRTGRFREEEKSRKEEPVKITNKSNRKSLRNKKCNSSGEVACTDKLLVKTSENVESSKCGN